MLYNRSICPSFPFLAPAHFLGVIFCGTDRATEGGKLGFPSAGADKTPRFVREKHQFSTYFKVQTARTHLRATGVNLTHHTSAPCHFSSSTWFLPQIQERPNQRIRSFLFSLFRWWTWSIHLFDHSCHCHRADCHWTKTGTWDNRMVLGNGFFFCGGCARHESPCDMVKKNLKLSMPFDFLFSFCSNALYHLPSASF